MENAEKYFLLVVIIAVALTVVAVITMTGSKANALPNMPANNSSGASSSNNTTAPSNTIYNYTNSTNSSAPSGQHIAVNLSQELNNSANAGFSLSMSDFQANSAAQCSRQLISSCDNNVPSQFICVNSNYSSEVQSQYAKIYANGSHVCPEYILAGTVSCGVSAGYCVVTSSGSTTP